MASFHNKYISSVGYLYDRYTSKLFDMCHVIEPQWVGDTIDNKLDQIDRITGMNKLAYSQWRIQDFLSGGDS